MLMLDSNMKGSDFDYGKEGNSRSNVLIFLRRLTTPTARMNTFLRVHTVTQHSQRLDSSCSLILTYLIAFLESWYMNTHAIISKVSTTPHPTGLSQIQLRRERIKDGQQSIEAAAC